MTTIPGHNIVIQQSGRAHDATHHLKPVQPDPEHLQNQQVTREVVEQTTVQSSENESALNNDVNADEKRKENKKRRLLKRKKKKKNPESTKGQYPDLPGNLLNTVA
ncbi:conserved hypothetical protein [Desulfamplus magnetovallimortis]|uniref:Uncharacterized protein n=1 Tax=Desulfamplus magnetovallimortis TaxID=1246637 RepID=A0A1W1HA29_9BACT|nr:hypothetical protein [Desulfamplus magnetovallimortis]SLM29238.1 conserved hypothetical protein [Desulfamplus magnetovallimortis]